MVNMSFLKEVSQKRFFFELQSFNMFQFEGSLAKVFEPPCKLHFLKEVSQKRKSPTRLNPKPVDNQIT